MMMMMMIGLRIIYSMLIIYYTCIVNRTCMQGDIHQKKYTNIAQTGKSICAEYGLRQGMFKGLGWRIGSPNNPIQ